MTSSRHKVAFLLALFAPRPLAAIDRVPLVPAQPFVIDNEAGAKSPLDMSFLLDAPAGKLGFIGREGDHLIDRSGRRVRLWGVNVSDWTPGSIQIPAKADSPFWARTLARYGINVVRLTFLDFTNPRGLIERDRADTRALNPAKLDDFDTWVFELKKAGIYVDINLLVGRTFKDGDGVVDNKSVGWAKALAYFDTRLIDLQKEFAKELLTHVNPYTGNSYANEPAVAIVELVNENSLWDAWYYDRLHPPVEWSSDVNFRPTPKYYSDELDRLYNRYLTEHLTAGQQSEIRAAARVADGEPVPRMHKSEWVGAPAIRLRTEARFIIGVEQGFFREMRRFMREDLGVKSLLLGSSDYLQEHSNYGMVLANTELDLTDGHVYWEHPLWEGSVNSPMVNDPLASTVVRLSRAATTSRPYTVTEFNHPWPNDWECEGLPIAAAYGSLQGWSALMVYSFEPKVRLGYEGYIGDAFDISHHPVKMPQMMAGALFYLRGDVAEAKNTVVRTYSREQVETSIRLPLYQSPYYTPGFPLQLALEHKMRIGSFDGPPTASFSEPPSNPIVSDTGELAWYTTPFNTGLVTVDSPRSQALIGFVKANEVETSCLAAQVTNNFCALTLSSLDEHPITSSGKMLLTAGSRATNTAFAWNSNRTNAAPGGTGHSPSLIETVTGKLTLRRLVGARSVIVQPLDGAGHPEGPPLPASRSPDGWQFEVGSTVTTWYVIDVQR